MSIPVSTAPRSSAPYGADQARSCPGGGRKAGYFAAAAEPAPRCVRSSRLVSRQRPLVLHRSGTPTGSQHQKSFAAARPPLHDTRRGGSAHRQNPAIANRPQAADRLRRTTQEAETDRLPRESSVLLDHRQRISARRWLRQSIRYLGIVGLRSISHRAAATSDRWTAPYDAPVPVLFRICSRFAGER